MIPDSLLRHIKTQAKREGFDVEDLLTILKAGNASNEQIQERLAAIQLAYVLRNKGGKQS